VFRYRSDYFPVVFTDEQWTALTAVFPDGVCDYAKPGVGFQPTVPWLHYGGGAGGQPLGPPPRSAPIETRP
jgi:hypothetical protein